jgi:DnaJ domain
VAKTEINIEEFFTNVGIKWDKKEWLYLCHLEGRQFYYSPRTGKWRMKGKRSWQFSQSPEDFTNQALQYLPPNSRANQTSNNEPKNQQKTSDQKTQTKRKKPPKYSDYSSHFRNEQFNSENVQGIRLQFLETFGEFLKIQRERGYKLGWIVHCLLKQYVLTPEEICWLCVVCGYSPGWAFHQIKNTYGRANWEGILKLIEENQDRWWDNVKTRWGIEDNQKYQRDKEYQKRNKFSQDTFSYESYLKTLKISFPFTKEELKTAYRKRALETHPDTGGTGEDFRAVYTAYQILLVLLSV